MALDWDKIRIFHAVASAGSFTHAGEALGLSQSAISRQIATLEDSLGIILFHRHARGLVMTEQGELLFHTTRDVFTKLAMIEGQLSDTRDKAEGPLTITASEFIGTWWLAPLLPRFLDQYPDIAPTLTLDDRVLNLGLREADVALRLFPPQENDLIQRPLAKINFGLYASENYLDRQGTPHDLHDLSSHHILTFSDTPPYPCSGGILEHIPSSKRPKIKITRTNTVTAMAELVRAGVGIAVLPDFMMRGQKSIIRILDTQIFPAVDLYFVYPEVRRHSKRIEIFRDFLLQNIDTAAF